MKSALFLLLTPLSWLFQLGVALKNAFYDKKLLSSLPVRPLVVSVGNLSMGGTGKTPWVLEIARRLKAQNTKIGFVARGYKGSHQGILPVTIDSDPAECGDEPLLFAKRIWGPVYVSSSKTDGALELAQNEDVHCILLDDGFQHRKLKRELDIVIVDVTVPQEKHHLLPRGSFREPMSALKRADLVVLNKWNLSEVENQKYWELQVSKVLGAPPLIRASYKAGEPSLIKDKKTERLIDKSAGDTPAFDRTKPYICMAAIGNPQAFVRTCEDSFGCAPVDSFFLRDHAPWTREDILVVQALGKKKSVFQFVTTEKDGVKLSQWNQLLGTTLWELPIEVVVESGEEHLVKALSDLGRLL